MSSFLIQQVEERKQVSIKMLFDRFLFEPVAVEISGVTSSTKNFLPLKLEGGQL